MTPPPASGSPPGSAIKLTLYIAGTNRYSLQACANLRSLIDALEPGLETEVIDVVQQPELALSQGIFAIPALISVVRGSRMLFIGDLSERERVLSALRGAL